VFSATIARRARFGIVDAESLQRLRDALRIALDVD
jgi:hypothetical protein